LVLALPAVIVAGFVVWAIFPAGPMSDALDALVSDEIVRVSRGRWWTFTPAGGDVTSGIVIYPGGRVDARAYAPPARAIAAEGNLVVLMPMPLNLAFFGANRAGDVIAAHPEVEHWLVGGHSLGGAFAAEYAGQHADEVEGLVLWAAYPAASNDLSAYDGIVFSVYGTADGVATEEEILESLPLLPSSTRWIPIEGGNHAQFGSYGEQPGDNAAAITRADQQAQVASATVGALAEARGEFDWQPCCELH
jgi:pimeloyl-ACP methyl ester carboxylesterase